MITKTLIFRNIKKSPKSIKKSPTILLISSPNSMEFQPNSHSKSPNFILFFNHQMALFSNPNHLSNHQNYVIT
jgi:hypothetical protein